LLENKVIMEIVNH